MSRTGTYLKMLARSGPIVTDQEYFGLRLAFMANSAFMEA
jgi:hypothetical protein